MLGEFSKIGISLPLLVRGDHRNRFALDVSLNSILL